MDIREFNDILFDIMDEHNEITIDMSSFDEYLLDANEVARHLKTLKHRAKIEAYVPIKSHGTVEAFFVLRSVKGMR